MAEDKSPLVNFRTKPWFKAALQAQAQREGRTLAGLIHNILRQYMTACGWNLEQDIAPQNQKTIL